MIRKEDDHSWNELLVCTSVGFAVLGCLFGAQRILAEEPIPNPTPIYDVGWKIDANVRQNGILIYPGSVIDNKEDIEIECTAKGQIAGPEKGLGGESRQSKDGKYTLVTPPILTHKDAPDKKDAYEQVTPGFEGYWVLTSQFARYINAVDIYLNNQRLTGKTLIQNFANETSGKIDVNSLPAGRSTASCTFASQGQIMTANTAFQVNK